MNDDGYEGYEGYKGAAKAFLAQHNIRVGSQVQLETPGGSILGFLLPRSNAPDEEHLLIELPAGYRLGLHLQKIRQIQQRGFRPPPSPTPPLPFPPNREKPHVTLLDTGGLLVCRLEEHTGVLRPASSPGEIYDTLPEVADLCQLRSGKVGGVSGGEVAAPQWIELAQTIAQEIAQDVEGIVLAHRADTLHYTAAALSFMVQQPPIPIVLVGAQRPSDHPSSDAAHNLLCALRVAATGDMAGVFLCMPGSTSDHSALLHYGTRARPYHSSCRSAFRTSGDLPLATVNDSGITPLHRHYPRRRPDQRLLLDPVFDDHLCLLYCYPGMKPALLTALLEENIQGIVLAGTGLGQVSPSLYPPLQEACNAGVHVYMTVQSAGGYAQLQASSQGRDLLDLGVLSAANMLPEVAYIKLGWSLGHSHQREEVQKRMLTPIAQEITPRQPLSTPLMEGKQVDR